MYHFLLTSIAIILVSRHRQMPSSTPSNTKALIKLLQYTLLHVVFFTYISSIIMLTQALCRHIIGVVPE